MAVFLNTHAHEKQIFTKIHIFVNFRGQHQTVMNPTQKIRCGSRILPGYAPGSEAKVTHVMNLSCTSRAICCQSSGPAWGTVLEIVNMIPGTFLTNTQQK